MMKFLKIISIVFIRFIQMRDNEELRKRFDDDIPDVAEIAKKISLTFVNQHYSYTGPKPLSNQLIEVGGIHIKPEKPIPQASLHVFLIFQKQNKHISTKEIFVF